MVNDYTKVFLVVPTVRSLTFLRQWGNAFQRCSILVVEDHPAAQIKLPPVPAQEVLRFTWRDISDDFGEDAWIFSRKNAGIRAYGLWKAYQLGADVTITLDDDCYPVDENYVETHLANLSLLAPERWTTTYPHREFVFTRGIPYLVRGKRPVVVSHGLWTNKIDLDAQTQIKHQNINLPGYPAVLQFIPPGVYFPMCSMNLAFRREVTPLMYFPPMGSDPLGKLWEYDRFDDIWAGIFVKKIIDHLGLSVANGSPFVEHRKASDAQKNLQKEKKGLRTNEWLWKAVDRVELTKKTPAACYIELAKKIKLPKTQYFHKLRLAMLIWGKLFPSSEPTEAIK